MKTVEELLEECPVDHVYIPDSWKAVVVNPDNFTPDSQNLASELTRIMMQFLNKPYIFTDFPSHQDRIKWLYEIEQKYGIEEVLMLKESCMKNNKRSSVAMALQVLPQDYVGRHRVRFQMMAEHLVEETNRLLNTEDMPFITLYCEIMRYKEKVYDVMKFLSRE